MSPLGMSGSSVSSVLVVVRLLFRRDCVFHVAWDSIGYAHLRTWTVRYGTRLLLCALGCR